MIISIDIDKQSLIESLNSLESEIDYSKNILIEGFPEGINFGNKKLAEEEVIMRMYRNLQYLELSILKYLKNKGDK
jgi:hypothetical protein